MTGINIDKLVSNLAEKHNWDVAEEYGEPGYSGIPVETWVDEMKNDPTKAINNAQVKASVLEAAGFELWACDGNGGEFQNGWHQHMDDDPVSIYKNIRDEYGNDVDVVFHIHENSQFYISFHAYVRENVTYNYLSSNSFSHDSQLDDVLDYLRNWNEEQYNNLLHAFPEVDSRVLDGAYFDVEAMGVDQEWSAWVTDWVENNTKVMWVDGEPVIREADDYKNTAGK